MARSRVASFTRWWRTKPFRADIVFALVVGALTLAGHLSAPVEGSQRAAGALSVTIIAAQTMAFAFRRRAPLASVCAVVTATLAFWVLDYPTNFDAFSLLAVYAATAHGGADRRRVWRVVGSVVAVMTAIAIVGVLVASEDLPPIAVIGIAAIHLSAAITGEVVYDRTAEFEERARRDSAERELATHRAVLQERARIARDLHDVIAHGMSVMVVQAGAAQRLLDAHPEQAAVALEQVQTTGREALTEMRRMLGVLRNESEQADRAPQPTLDDLAAVVERCNEVGIPTRLTVEGTPPIRSAGAEMAAFRIVQEALTNVIKHAGRPVRASVRVTYSPEHVRLEVDDDGLGPAPGDLTPASGHGLVGMRERVELYGGTMHAGSRPGGGFRVSATIPLRDAGTARERLAAVAAEASS